MSNQMKELIKAESWRAEHDFLTKTIQRSRIRPAKFIHSLTFPDYLYNDLRKNLVIVPEDYFTDESAFFEFKNEDHLVDGIKKSIPVAIVSFVHLYSCEDLHRRSLEYLVKKFAGSCPIKRSAVSKMNFDKIIEPVVLVRTKTGKKSKV